MNVYVCVFACVDHVAAVVAVAIDARNVACGACRFFSLCVVPIVNILFILHIANLLHA